MLLASAVRCLESHLTGRDDDTMKPAIICAVLATGIAVGAPVLAEDAKKPADSKRFTLLCRAQLLKKTFFVDTVRRTVDGKPASFGEAAITWKNGGADAATKKGAKRSEAKNGGVKNGVTHELNRLEGTYRSWEDGEAPEKATTYGCEKAPPQVF
jgi:hypothetical protein